MTEPANHWILPVYGAPDGTSEVNRIPAFYRADSLTAFCPSPPVAEAGESPRLEVAATVRAVAEALLTPRPSATPA